VIRTPGAFVRTGLLVLLAVVVQISGLSGVQILGGTPDLIPLVVAAVAFYAGGTPGAITGFCTGLLLDLAIGQNVGASSLVLTAVGYGVGRFSDQRDISHGLLPIPVAAAATAGYLAAFAVVSFMLETAPQVSALILRDLVIVTLLNVAIALPFFGVVRRVLRPVVASELLDRRRKRREVQPSGPIGLRGLEVRR
jgi:rod shape-determining protein MreD